MAKKKKALAVDKKALSTQPSALSVADRCRRAFAVQARAQIDVEQLTKAEVAAFAELIDDDGEPLHLDVAGQPVRHCDRAACGLALAENVGQRFAKLWAAHVRRLNRAKDDAKPQAAGD